jgi:CRISPR-associated protein Cas1
MGKTAIIDQHGSFLGVKSGRFVLRVGGEEKWQIPPVELESIIFVVEGAAVSSAAISLATTFGIDLVFMKGSQPVARLIPYRYGTTMKNWLFQLRCLEGGGSLYLAKAFLNGKLHNQRMVLLEYARRLRGSGKEPSFLLEKATEVEKFASELRGVERVEDLLVVEGHAARSYWAAVSTILPPEIGFAHRYTRSNPPPGELDPFNAALNIGYALLRKEVWRAIFLAGLNPYLGFLHRCRGGRPALVLDLMEEFRPVSVDRPLIGLARTEGEPFIALRRGREKAARAIWSHLIRYMREGKIPHTELIMTQARKLVMHLRGQQSYNPYRSRW